MTSAEIGAIGQRLAFRPHARPLGGVQYVREADYLKLLADAQALYAAATAPAENPAPKAKA